MKNQIIAPKIGLNEIELRIYEALPRRWGDCNALIRRKEEHRKRAYEQILQKPADEIELIGELVKYDVVYE